MPRTLFAAICSPCPLPPSTMPRSARSVDDRAPDGGADRRIVHRGLAVRAVIVDLMAERCERLLQMLLERKPAWSAPIAIRMGGNDNTVPGSGFVFWFRFKVSSRSWTRTASPHSNARSELEWNQRSLSLRGAKSAFGTAISGCTGPMSQAAARSRRGRPRRRPAARFLARAFYSDRSQITLRILTRHDVPVDRALLARAPRAGDCVSRRARHRRDRVSSGARRRRSDPVAHRGSLWRLSRRCRRCRRGRDRLLPDVTALLVELLQPRGIIARNDPRVAAARRARAECRRAARRRSRQGVGARGPDRVRRGSAARPEDGRVSRSAREPDGGGAVRARPGARLLQLRRRLRACSSRRMPTS